MASQDKTEHWLLPYLEGAYAADAARLAEIEARLAADPALAAESARMRQMLAAVRGVAARTPRPETAAVPADSWPRLKTRLESRSFPPAPRRSLPWGWLGGAGAAVAVAAGVIAVVLPGHHTPPQTAKSTPPVTVASRPAPKALPATPPAAKTAPKPPQVAQAAPAPAPTGPLVKPNPNGLSDPFLTPPTPLPLRGASKTAPPPVVIKPVPGTASKPNPQIASRDITGDQASPEVAHPLLPLPVLPPTAPAPAAPPLPEAPSVPLAVPAAPPPRFERKMLRMPPASAGSAADSGQRQAFSTEAAPAAAPPAAAFGGGAFGGGPGRAIGRMAVPNRPREAVSADDAALLSAGTKALAEAVTAPLWGQNEGMQQSNETLTDVREAGLLDDLQVRLESRRAQMPRDLATGRMLAAVYDFSSTAQAALHERQRIASLDSADGEDFFQLGQAQSRAGNADAARAAYRRALTAPVPPSGFHAALARQGAQ